MTFDKLTDDNITLYLMKTYDNPQCQNLQEFWDDVNRIKYIKRLLRRYKDKGILKERLILNHLITFYNVFLPEHATRILFYKLEKDLWPFLASFLYFLNFLPEEIQGVSESTISTSNIVLDIKILDTLEKI
jgi:hypothetical protein